jgi:hypothetical protein
MKNFITVNSVKLPEDFTEKRGLRLDKKHFNETKLEAYDLAQYDYDTVFYDVFFDARNRFIYTIGPPFLNLNKSLFPITYRINDDSRIYKLKITEYFDELLAIGKIPLKDLQVYDENIIEFNFNNHFQWKGRIKLNKYKVQPIVLTTIQKNNRIQWIKEWVEFYSERHKVNQTIIYDNGSCNRDDLKTISDEHISIVAWDFKYGPIRSHGNQFCQLGSLNHCRLKFGLNNIIMNFDIDELLHLRSSNLNRYWWKYDLVLFNAYRVPFIKPLSEEYSYADFTFRDVIPQNDGYKYFFRPKAINVNNIHDALLKKRPRKIYRKLEHIFNKLNRLQSKNILLNSLINTMSLILRRKFVPICDGYFLHYTGITNNWKSIYWDRKKETILTDKHIRFEI